MMFKTHIMFGLLAALCALSYFQPADSIFFIFFVLFGSALPDIDHPNSFIGKKTKIIAWLFEHRGFWHSLFALIPISFAFSFVLAKINLYALFIGYASHLIIDAATKEGIMLFHPLSKFRIRGFIHTGGLMEYVLLAVIAAADLYFVNSSVNFP